MYWKKDFGRTVLVRARHVAEAHTILSKLDSTDDYRNLPPGRKEVLEHVIHVDTLAITALLTVMSGKPAGRFEDFQYIFDNRKLREKITKLENLRREMPSLLERMKTSTGRKFTGARNKLARSLKRFLTMVRDILGLTITHTRGQS